MTNRSDEAEFCCTGQRYDGVCENLGAKYVHNGNHYCVLHYPSDDKGDAFLRTLDEVLRNPDGIDLRGVWMPSQYSAYFRSRTLETNADFSGAFFRGTDFSNATFNGTSNFYNARFHSASFRRANFYGEASFSSVFCGGADFSYATFHEAARFRDTDFSDGVASFVGTDFGKVAVFERTDFRREASFTRSTFKGEGLFKSTNFHEAVDFQGASFTNQILFQGTIQNRVFCTDKRVNFRYAQVGEKAQLSFHTVVLRPSWFVDVNPRTFEFVDVCWHRLESWQRAGRIRDELQVARLLGGQSPAILLEKTCQELASNAEENRRHIEASRFRYGAMEARRKQNQHGRWPVSLIFWYWLLSGYGELQGRALIWLALILLGFAGFYLLVGFPQHASKQAEILPSYWQSLIYSLGIMTRQRLAIEPEPGVVQLLVILEGIVGPLQIALFALAVRRKFIQ